MSPDKLTPQLIAQQLAQMSQSDLLQLRNQPGADQNYLAPYEHRAFARELTQEKPYMAVPLLLGTPVYEIAKLLSPSNLGARSKPSLQSVIQGWKGLGDAAGIKYIDE